jgi:ATP-dependent DNA ligase
LKRMPLVSWVMRRSTREHGLEGVVAKRLGSPYVPGVRNGAWLKHLSEVSDKCFYLKSRVI